MSRAFLLVPSPLLGPSSWEPMAEVARERGHDVAVADLRPALEDRGSLWPELVRAARSAGRSLQGEVDVVAHSGAGALLPGIGATMGSSLGRIVFVDAVIPPATGAHHYPESIRGRVAELAEDDGLLPPWLDWWPTETVAEMLPDPALAELLRSDLPRAPLRWFDEAVPVPIAWTEWEAIYVQLSPAYEDEAGRAKRLGWPTVRVDSHHLGIVTEPETVFESLMP